MLKLRPPTLRAFAVAIAFTSASAPLNGEAIVQYGGSGVDWFFNNLPTGYPWAWLDRSIWSSDPLSLETDLTATSSASVYRFSGATSQRVFTTPGAQAGSLTSVRAVGTVACNGEWSDAGSSATFDIGANVVLHFELTQDQPVEAFLTSSLSGTQRPEFRPVAFVLYSLEPDGSETLIPFVPSDAFGRVPIGTITGATVLPAGRYRLWFDFRLLAIPAEFPDGLSASGEFEFVFNVPSPSTAALAALVGLHAQRTRRRR